MKQEKCALPVTAIAFVDLPSLGGPLVLGAEGSSIRIFRLEPHSILWKQQIFARQVIHGIQCHCLEEGQHVSASGSLTCVIWGGREIASVLLKIIKESDEVSISCTPFGLEATIDDYVLDACHFSAPSHLPEPQISTLRALAVTTHNTLFSITFSISQQGEEKAAIVNKVAEGVPCSLYSAHIKALDANSVLIASGTVFGAVHVWRQSVSPEESAIGCHLPTTGLCSFSGHEGSVFGVRIFQIPYFPPTDFVVSSCSDDRSINLWLVRGCDITPLSLPSREIENAWEDTTGFLKKPETAGRMKQPLLTSVMGHLSRIWSTRISHTGIGRILLFSFGEDGTSQAWQIPCGSLAAKTETRPLTLQLDHSLGHHIGKNIWAGEIYNGAEDLVVTGGADGRIALSRLQSQDEKCLWSSDSDNLLPSGSLGLTSNLKAFPAQDGRDSAIKGSDANYNQSQVEGVDIFKSYTWLSESCLLATTAKGRVKLGALRPKARTTSHSFSMTTHPPIGPLQVDWTCLGQLEELASFSLVSSAPGQFALLTGDKGNVYIYLAAKNSLQAFLDVPRKVSFLFCSKLNDLNGKTKSFAGQELGAVFTCIGMRKAYFVTFDIQTASSPLRAQDSLRSAHLPEAFVTTSAAFLSFNVLALGSRAGDLALYNVGDGELEDSISPVLTYAHLHGTESITSITEMSISQSKLVATTGRDGHVAIHSITSIENLSFKLQTIHRVLLPFGPNIEGALLPNDTNELFLWGFNGLKLVVWNYRENREIMNVDCGGKNRNWSYLPSASGTGGGSLAWTRASECHVYLQSEASHTLLQSGTHGREVKAIAIRSDMGDQLGCIVATGAEDTTIRISEYREASPDMLKQPFDCLGVLLNHTTGIQRLAWSSNGSYLFSAAGKEEFNIWQVEPVPRIRIGIINVACCPKVSESGDLRIMDFDILDDAESKLQDSYLIALAYSDSTIRLWRFVNGPLGSRLLPLLSTQYSTVCLTQCQFVDLGSKPHILTCATDGHLVLWRLERPSKLSEDSISDPKDFEAPTTHEYMNQAFSENVVAGAIRLELSLWASLKIHQSSIKSTTSQILSDTSVLVITGGDDNAIGITIVQVASNTQTGEIVPRLTSLLIPNAHASAVNALTSWRRDEDVRQQQTPDSPAEEHISIADDTSFTFVSASNDQSLKRWTVSVNCPLFVADAAQEFRGSTLLHTDSFHISKRESRWSSIADVAAMEVIKGSASTTKRRVILAGVGIETWTMDRDGLGLDEFT
ncbi:hypothetical protein MMC10_001972 [Thelotrema lepadinum]|nr:hypothetical protein [Thelotrema lepadinum]